MASETDDSAPDFDRLARRYLELWQGQLAALAADPQLVEQIARLFANGVTNAATAPGSAPGTPPAAAAPGDGARELDELRKRLADLEARLAWLEARLASH